MLAGPTLILFAVFALVAVVLTVLAAIRLAAACAGILAAALPIAVLLVPGLARMARLGLVVGGEIRLFLFVFRRTVVDAIAVPGLALPGRSGRPSMMRL